MTKPRPDIAIVSSAHWSGDARLNRHVRYLTQAGYEISLYASSESISRAGSAISALMKITRTRARFVILPDPELFFLGSLIARLRGKKPILDIHEDYAAAVASRGWAPALLKPLIRFLARLNVWLGRLVAWRVTVAAPELAKRGDTVVMNLPEPQELSAGRPAPHSHRIVYVGDVTVSRGALEMVETLSLLDDRFSLILIGRVDEQTWDLIRSKARELEVDQRLELLGRLPHAQAWDTASGAVAGLCLLRSLPAYRMAVATKIWEYMAAGLPPVVSDLPGQASVVSQIDRALICSSPVEVAAIIRRLDGDPEWGAKVVTKGLHLVSARWEERRPDLAIQETVSP